MIARALGGYTLVSGLCFALNSGIMVAAERAAIPWPEAVVASFAALVVIGYLLHSRVTFRSPIGLAAFARYAAAMSVNAPSLVMATWFTHDIVGLTMGAAAPLSSLCATAVNFALCRLAIGRDRSKPASSTQLSEAIR